MDFKQWKSGVLLLLLLFKASKSQLLRHCTFCSPDFFINCTRTIAKTMDATIECYQHRVCSDVIQVTSQRLFGSSCSEACKSSSFPCHPSKEKCCTFCCSNNACGVSYMSQESMKRSSIRFNFVVSKSHLNTLAVNSELRISLLHEWLSLKLKIELGEFREGNYRIAILHAGPYANCTIEVVALFIFSHRNTPGAPETIRREIASRAANLHESSFIKHDPQESVGIVDYTAKCCPSYSVQAGRRRVEFPTTVTLQADDMLVRVFCSGVYSHRACNQYAYGVCKPTGEWDEAAFNITNCPHEEEEEATKEIQTINDTSTKTDIGEDKLPSLDVNVTVKNAENLAESLASFIDHKISAGSAFSPWDMHRLSVLMEKLSDIDGAMTESVARLGLGSIARLVDRNISALQELVGHSMASTRFRAAVEHTARKVDSKDDLFYFDSHNLAAVTTASHMNAHKQPYVQCIGYEVKVGNESMLMLRFSTEVSAIGEGLVKVPLPILVTTPNGTLRILDRLAIILYRDEVLFNKDELYPVPSGKGRRSTQYLQLHLNSHIVSVTSSDPNVTQLRPIMVQFRHINPLHFGPECTMWGKGMNSDRMNWNRKYKSLQHTDNYTSVCSFDEVGSYALWMKFKLGSKPSLKLENNVFTAMFIGSVIPIVAFCSTLIGCIVAWRRRSQSALLLLISLNISISFLVEIIVTLVGLQMFLDVREKHTCQTLGPILHLASMASYTWSAVATYHAYSLMKGTRAMNEQTSQSAALCKVMIVAWSFPAFVAGITFVSSRIASDIYKRQNNGLCWFTLTASLVAYILPMLVTLAVACALSIAAFSFYRQHLTSAPPDRRVNFCTLLKPILLFTITSAHHVFKFIAMETSHIVLLVLHGLCTGLVGIYVLIYGNFFEIDKFLNSVPAEDGQEAQSARTSSGESSSTDRAV